MFTRILVPVDFTEPATKPLETAVELARAGGGTVVLLSVVDDSFPNPDILSFQMPWADYYRHLREAARAKLVELQQRCDTDCPVDVCVVRGNPARAIAEFAEEEGCDLIVMATHGARGLQHALLGSVTRRVLHLAPCPVLVLRLAAGKGRAARGRRTARPRAS